MDTGSSAPDRHPRLKGLVSIAYGVGVWAVIAALMLLVRLVVGDVPGGDESTGWTGFLVDLTNGLLAEVAGVVGGLLVVAGLIGVVTGPRAARKADEAATDEFMARLTKGGRPPHSSPPP